MMLINLRNGMMGGKRKPPYDARVAWLQSDGTAYIQLPDVLGFTGLQAKNMPDFSITVYLAGIFQSETDSGQSGICGFSGNALMSAIRAPKGDSTAWAIISFNGATSATKTDYPASTDVISLGVACVHSDARPMKRLINSDIKADAAITTSSTYLAPPRIFAYGSTDSSGWTSVAGIAPYVKVSRVELTKNGMPVLNAYAVRVGNVGYVYDSVSEQFYGNAGAGALITGPDAA